MDGLAEQYNRSVSYFPDLSPYRYGLHAVGWDELGPPVGAPERLFVWAWNEAAFELPEVNIGWLDARHEFALRTPERRFARALDVLCRGARYHLTRGFHGCELCGAWAPDGLGSAEIRVEGGRVVYAAPNLVAHYVRKHRYAPPDDFVASVLRANGRSAEPVAGTERVIPPELLVRESVDLGALRDRVFTLLAEDYRSDSVLALTFEMHDGKVLAGATFAPSRACDPLERRWSIPEAWFLNVEQAARGVYAMLNDVMNTAAMASYEQWQREREGR
jgi:hypothetical protein